MSEREKEELARVIGNMTRAEMEVAAAEMPTEILLDTVKRRITSMESTLLNVYGVLQKKEELPQEREIMVIGMEG